jgi:hypothetical protein
LWQYDLQLPGRHHRRHLVGHQPRYAETSADHFDRRVVTGDMQALPDLGRAAFAVAVETSFFR